MSVIQTRYGFLLFYLFSLRVIVLREWDFNRKRKGEAEALGAPLLRPETAGYLAA